MIKGILDRLKFGGSARHEPDSGFSAADQKAFQANFAPADAIEPGFGADIARFIVTGEGESVRLRIETILKAGGDKSVAMYQVLRTSWYSSGNSEVSAQEQARRRKLRQRLVYELEGFDAAGLRRFGQILACSDRATYGLGSDRSPAWLRNLFDQVQNNRHVADADNFEGTGYLTGPRVREMLAVEGEPLSALVDIVFFPNYQAGVFKSMPDLATVLEAKADAVLRDAGSLSAETKGNLLLFLSEAGAIGRVPGYFDFAFASAAAKAKVLREPAIAALTRVDRDRVVARASAALGSSTVDERIAAITVLAELLGADALPQLEAHQASETSKPVMRLIETLRPKLALARETASASEGDGPDSYTALDGSVITAPPRQETRDEIPADTAEVLAAMMAETAAISRTEYDNPNTPDYVRKHRGRYAPPHDPKTIPQIIKLLKGEWPRDKDPPSLTPKGYHFPESSAAYARTVKSLFDRPDFGIKALVRLYIAQRHDPWGYMLRSIMRGEPNYEAAAGALGRRIAKGADFRDVIDGLEACGLPAAKGLPDLTRYLSWQSQESADAPNPTIWTVFSAHFERIDAMLAELGAARRSNMHGMLLGLCETFPKPPRRYLDLLLDAATQGGASEKRRARALLATAGDLTPVIVPLLDDGSASKRAAAARWLGERKEASAIPPLRALLPKEKTLPAKAAILAALAACGDDISDQFSEDSMLAEAARERPKLKVDFSPLIDPKALPALRWADGRSVDPTIVDYWFARAHKLKQPGGDPLLHMALERLDRNDAAAMGRTLLSSFIQLDTHKASSEEANTYAQANAQARHQSYLRWRKDYTYEEAFDTLRREKLAEYLGSALDHRGLLALARYAPAGEAVALVSRYLRDHGKRANQNRALLDMLAGNPVPQVLQFLLDVGQRQKQPGTRKHAGELAAAVAEERGWSATELADRTVPTLDLDERGTREIPIGDKVFSLRLEESAAGALKLAIVNPAGKTVASLPSPSDPAEAEAARAAKKLLSTSKKELSQTVELQTRRFYEAMCVGRHWDAQDFLALFIPHPILSRLLRRLVLSLHDADGKLTGSARLLEDGSLTDSADGSVALDDVASVGLAHRATLGEAASEAWTTHLSDYEVAPLFPQVDRPILALPDRTATLVEDRQGFMLDNFALRSGCAKLGYQPGSVEDGGSYGAYEKAFPDLGLAAVIGFGGDYMGNTDKHPAPLHGLSFMRVKSGGKASGWGSEGIELGKVPPILLQEAWNDYHAIAAIGTGFDAEWRKKGFW